MRNFRRQFNKFSQEEGSFTVEASMLFPFIFMIIVGLLFFCLYTYQKVFLVYIGSVAAERTVYNWDNSSKEASTGAFPYGQFDGLYWRLTDDQTLDVLFGLTGQALGTSYALHRPGDEGSSLPIRKMANASAVVPEAVQGTMLYQNQGWKRSVTVEVLNPLRFRPLEWLVGGKASLQTQVRSSVVDPVEFIRTVELVRYYGAKFKNAGGGGGSPVTQDQARQVLEQQRSKGRK
ncbi:pilus assembly protein [Paenibacillus guangzhouensis]|uniref:pilus assembly protein n=1 Tax=Paenibacillus guangzhouensis TaxID=1473112 RepID=UPI0012676C69|nr:pilus assembly protein [Paenibacillus guangzhouensis]